MTTNNKTAELREANCAICKAIKAPAMMQTYQYQLNDPTYESMSFDARLNLLLKAEAESRAIKRKERNLKNAHIPKPGMAYLDNIDWDVPRGLKQSMIESLCDCEWLRCDLKPWVIIQGTTGVGKSFVAKVLTHAAIAQGFTAAYYDWERLIVEVQDAKDCGKILNFRKSLQSKQLLVIDEFGSVGVSDEVAGGIVSIIDDRIGDGSLIIVGQVAIDKWHTILGDPLKADSFMDRVINQSYRIEMSGPSMRERYGAIHQLEARKESNK